MLDLARNVVEAKADLVREFTKTEPGWYPEIWSAVCRKMFGDDVETLDMSVGSYQGKILLLAGDRGKIYKSVVSYGSCSNCDTLESIKDGADPVSRAEDYYTLGLHMAQRMEVVLSDY